MLGFLNALQVYEFVSIIFFLRPCKFMGLLNGFVSRATFVNVHTISEKVISSFSVCEMAFKVDACCISYNHACIACCWELCAYCARVFVESACSI